MSGKRYNVQRHKKHADLSAHTESRFFIAGFELCPAGDQMWHVPGQTIMSTVELEDALGCKGTIREVTRRSQ